MATEPAIYAGSFDPITYGHLDIIQRMSTIFQPFTVLVAYSPWKTPYFSLKERMKLIQECVKDSSSVKVDCHKGMLVDYAIKNKVRVLIRGARLISDFEYESSMANTNKNLHPEIETLIAFTQSKYAHYSSKMVQEVARNGGDVSAFVPPVVHQAVLSKQKGD